MIKEIYYEEKNIYKNICLYIYTKICLYNKKNIIYIFIIIFIIKKKIILKNKKNKNLLTL